MKTRVMKAGWGIGLMLLLALLAACGDTTHVEQISQPDKPCNVIEGPKPPNADKAPLLVDLATSPTYCGRVSDDFLRAMQWYQDQIKDNVYAPTMSTELGDYYTGEILQQSRASLVYNQQAGRVVAGHWKLGQLEIKGAEWDKAGYTVKLLVKAPGYEQWTFPVGQLDKATVVKGSPYESWLMTLVYDAKATHWKIKQAQTIIEKAEKQG